MRLRVMGISLALVLLLIADSAMAQRSRKATRAKNEASSRIANQAKAEGDAPEADAAKEKPAGDPSKDKADAEGSNDKKPAHKIEKATFGGGCFWCQEAVFQRIPGVRSVTSGYAGGEVAFPSYEMVHSGLTGHAEVVQIEFDSSVVSYEHLLNIFWVSHDPTKLNMQADDVGTQYRSIILYASEEQKKAAIKSYQELKAKRTYRSPIVTQLVPLTVFYPAEGYHQNYYNSNAMSDYSISHILPKLRKLNTHGAFAPERKKSSEGEKEKEKASAK